LHLPRTTPIMDEEFTIIIPVYNEKDNLQRVEETMTQYLRKVCRSTTVLFVNDGSSDNSLAMIDEICKRQKAFHYISFSKNQVLSAAIKAGFDYVKTPIVGYIDSDLQTNPEDFDLLLPEIDQYDLVTGLRTGRKDSFIKNTSSWIANRIRRSFTHDGIDDTVCTFKVIVTVDDTRIINVKRLQRFLPAMIILQN